jgi:hypothetical protein
MREKSALLSGGLFISLLVHSSAFDPRCDRATTTIAIGRYAIFGLKQFGRPVWAVTRLRH